MIQINYNTGRLGNSLFTHFYACVLSIENQCKIENPLDSKISIYENKDQENDQLLIETDPSCYYQERPIVEKFERHKTRLFLKTEERDGVFVHVRIGVGKDCKYLIRGGRVPTIEYYRQQLKKIKTNNGGYISSDWPTHGWIIELCEEFGLMVYSGEPEETIIFGSQFKNKILSLGTFSWWIGFLGSQNNVLCPNPNNYPRWHGPIFDCMDDWSKV